MSWRLTKLWMIQAEKKPIKEHIMNEPENSGSGSSGLTVAQEYLRQLWEEHVRHEFATHNTEDTLATMVEGPQPGAGIVARPDANAVGTLGDPDLDRVVGRDALAELDLVWAAPPGTFPESALKDQAKRKVEFKSGAADAG